MTAQHILIPIHDFSAGGTELIAFRLARAWIAAGRRVSILAGASDGPLAPRVPDGVAVHVLSPECPRTRTSRLHLGKLMAPVAQALEPDAVFIPGNFHFALAKPLKKALPGAPIVAKVSNPLLSGRGSASLFARFGIKAVTRGIDCLVAMAPSLRSDVTRFVDQRRVTVIADPFLDDETVFTARPRKPARPRHTLHILTVGRLEEQKDPQLALAVLAELLRDRHDVSLTLLGGGPLEATLHAEIAQNPDFDGRLTLAGYSDNPQAFYAAADMLLMTSQFEGVPAVIGEALANGLPFVATDCSRWLTALAGDHPTLGTAVEARDPAALAEALLQKAVRPNPTVPAIEAGIGAHRIGRAAQAYLELFDSLA
ncbi:MAG: glycosyltransferase [Sphingobium sp.]|nr:glycosyltransferase [Sphingobium sp.]